MREPTSNAAGGGADTPVTADTSDIYAALSASAAPDVAKKTVAELARLSAIEYDWVRKSTAEQLGVSVTALDVDVKRARPVRSQSTEPSATGIEFEDIEPWPHPVLGAELLDEVARTVRRFVVLPEQSERAAALWVTFSWLIEYAKVAPILAISSPEKGCGKTTMLDVLAALVARPVACANVSPAALFRIVEKHGPTLLIDEGDAFLRENEALRGILNSGHTRTTAYVIRTVGESFEPQRFSTWGAKAIALIGRLPDTLRDRSIPIDLHRKLPNEKRDKFRHADGSAFADLRRRLARFAQDSARPFAKARPPIPEGLHNRAADNWEPLLAVADIAGGSWAEMARRAAEKLSASAARASESASVRLLADVREIFEQIGTDRIASGDLLQRLNADETKPWGESAHGGPLTPRRLHSLLSVFEIPAPVSVRLPDGANRKGYVRHKFEDAFSRYLPGRPVSDPSRRHEQTLAQPVTKSNAATADAVCQNPLPSQPSTDLGCDTVTDSEPPPDQNRQFGGFVIDRPEQAGPASAVRR